MLGQIGKGLLTRLLSYGGLALGFWLLFLAFERSSILHGIAGGLTILAAMYLLTAARRGGPPATTPVSGETREDNPGDSSNGSSQGDKLSP